MMEREKAIERMERLCSRSEHCSSEILTKLRSLDVDAPEEIVGKLCREGYIDDYRYARAFARDKSSLQGWGSLKIKLALQAKGIGKDIVNDALAQVDLDAAMSRLGAMLVSKMHTLSSESDEQQRFAKLVRYAMGRGYDYDTVKRVYNSLSSEERSNICEI